MTAEQVTGWVAAAAGAAAIAALVFLILLYTVGQPFGTLNDICNALLGILGALLAWRLAAHAPQAAQIWVRFGILLAFVGALFTVIGSVLVIFGFTGWLQAGWWTGVGNGLIGLWLVVFSGIVVRSGVLPNNLGVFGLVTGICLAASLLSAIGIVRKIDSMEALPPVMYVAFLGFLGVYLLFPIWAIWLGEVLRGE